MAGTRTMGTTLTMKKAGQQNRDFEIQTPSGTKLALNGYFSSFGFGEKTTDGLDTFKATIRVSGTPTYTSAS